VIDSPIGWLLVATWQPADMHAASSKFDRFPVSRSHCERTTCRAGTGVHFGKRIAFHKTLFALAGIQQQ
jgi:hypothetical protein